MVIAYYYSARVLCAKFVRPTRGGTCAVPTWDHRDRVSSTKGQHAMSVRRGMMYWLIRYLPSPIHHTQNTEHHTLSHITLSNHGRRRHHHQHISDPTTPTLPTA